MRRGTDLRERTDCEGVCYERQGSIIFTSLGRERSMPRKGFRVGVVDIEGIDDDLLKDKLATSRGDLSIF